MSDARMHHMGWTYHLSYELDIYFVDKYQTKDGEKYPTDNKRCYFCNEIDDASYKIFGTIKSPKGNKLNIIWTCCDQCYPQMVNLPCQTLK